MMYYVVAVVAVVAGAEFVGELASAKARGYTEPGVCNLMAPLLIFYFMDRCYWMDA